MSLRRWILIAVLFSMIVGCDSRYSSGDRVLVSKNAYDNGFTGPNRYDVVVFKFPEKPMDRNTPKNYIKRLLGLPGELLAIFFGRVYRWTPPQGAPLPFDDQKDAEGKAIDPLDLWQHKYLHADDPTSKKWFEEGQFEILRKPPQTMLALRRIVYDNDFQAKDLKGKLDRWSPSPKSNWKQDNGTGFLMEGKAEGQIDWLRYKHLVRPDGVVAGGAQEKERLITDTMAYNSCKTLWEDRDERGKVIRNVVTDKSQSIHPHWVGDLMLECNVEVAQPAGEFCLELSKGVHRYQASFDLANGNCTLYRLSKDGNKEVRTELAVQATRVKTAGNYMLRFANIDARLTVWVDSALPFGDGKAYDPPEIRGKRGPDENDLQPASLGSKGAQVKVTHLRLWRDTYYTASTRKTDYDQAPNTWSDPKDWNSLREQHFTTLYVQPGHYLCLGDNSQASSDSRDWGLVPERLMLGRALVVYFPLDRVGKIR